MSNTQELNELFNKFQASYNTHSKDETWHELSQKFRKFWVDRVLASGQGEPLSEAECDEIIRILDRNGKGNTKDSEAVAKAMIPQGAWRRMFNEFRTNPELSNLVDRVLKASNSEERAHLIDQLYAFNEGQRNHLTGPSGNAIGALLAAYDPGNNLSVISLNDRRAIIDFFNFPISFDWGAATIGARMSMTNGIILDGIRSLGIDGSARTLSNFFYFPAVKANWKGEQTVKLVDQSVNVIVPVESDEEDIATGDAEPIRESMQIQGILAKIGAAMGFSIWLPRADRSRVLKVWNAEPGQLADALPLGYDPTTMKTIEQIDVLWMLKRSIVRAFEVEHTTSIYSGLLRMADLVALQPNIEIKLHIVAPVEKREKVLEEIRRPVFSLLEGRALSKMCTYLSYDKVHEIMELKHLNRLRDDVLEEYEEPAE